MTKYIQFMILVLIVQNRQQLLLANFFYATCLFGSRLKSKLILLFSLFLLLFMNPTVLFGTIHESYCTISTNFQQKVFSFNKISRSQTDPTYYTCLPIHEVQNSYQLAPGIAIQNSYQLAPGIEIWFPMVLNHFVTSPS